MQDFPYKEFQETFAWCAIVLLAFIVSLAVCMEIISLLFYWKDRKQLRFEIKELKKENEALKKLLE